jgi:hypothetical protein
MMVYTELRNPLYGTLGDAPVIVVGAWMGPGGPIGLMVDGSGTMLIVPMERMVMDVRCGPEGWRDISPRPADDEDDG